MFDGTACNCCPARVLISVNVTRLGAARSASMFVGWRAHDMTSFGFMREGKAWFFISSSPRTSVFGTAAAAPIGASTLLERAGSMTVSHDAAYYRGNASPLAQPTESRLCRRRKSRARRLT
jgi:hypothetical protein